MTDLWSLPRQLELEGEPYGIRWDYRAALEVMALLNEASLPLHTRWFRALKVFYLRPVPDRLCAQAMAAMADFLSQGREAAPGPALFDWQQDAPEIISDINRVAGFEVRNEDVHWWTFLAWFRAIGEGQLSFLVGLREKLLRGKPLTEAEREFCRRHPDKARLRRPDPEKQRLEDLLAER